jgi:hypothetical protein
MNYSPAFLFEFTDALHMANRSEWERWYWVDSFVTKFNTRTKKRSGCEDQLRCPRFVTNYFHLFYVQNTIASGQNSRWRRVSMYNTLCLVNLYLIPITALLVLIILLLTCLSPPFTIVVSSPVFGSLSSGCHAGVAGVAFC